MTPGIETSEYKLAKYVSIAGLVLTVVGVILEALAQAGIGTHWVGVGITVIGALMKVVTMLGYSKDRTALKVAESESKGEK